jgi:hypothetical protein
MGMEQRETWSLNRLATELGVDRRSLARRLEDVEPAGKGPKGDKLYRLRDALDALGESPIAPPGSLGGGRAQLAGGRAMDLSERRLYERGGPMATMTGDDVCRIWSWGWSDLAELLGWGAPFIEAGKRGVPSGWVFAFPHFGIWLADLAHDLNVRGDFRSVPVQLRRLRGARDLFLPTGFSTLPLETPSATRTRPRKARGAAKSMEDSP